MKLLQVLGHNANWNIDSYFNQNIGDEFLITAFTFGEGYRENKRIQPVIDKCAIDLQFYGQKNSSHLSKGKLAEFSFHPANFSGENTPTNIYIIDCIKRAIDFQIEQGFKKIIIPHYYEDDYIEGIISIIKVINSYIKKRKSENIEYYMTVPLAYDMVRNADNVDRLLFSLTDMEIQFDGYFIACENKPEQGRKISIDNKLITNLSKILKVLKNQSFKIIYAYANWDALFYLAQTDIDYITIGTYENLRNFSIRRFTENISGGASDGYYFSEKLLNMIRAKDLANIRNNGMLDLISNDKNIFSDIILKPNYQWNIHKPDVNKNYLLSVSKLLKNTYRINSIHDRIMYVLSIIMDAIRRYQSLDQNYVVLQSEGQNYHLEVWLAYLLKTIQMQPEKFYSWYKIHHIKNKE